MDGISTEFYTFNCPRQQIFLLPPRIISYITQFPSSRIGLKKLQQTCKYFYAKKKIIYIDKLLYYDGENSLNCFGDFCDFYFPLGKTKNQYWIERIECNIPFSYLRPYVYRCNLKELKFSMTKCLLNDLDFLLKNNKIEVFEMKYANVEDEDGEAVPIEYIVKKIPSVKCFSYDNEYEMFSNEKLEKLNSIKFLNKIESFELNVREIYEKIDAKILFTFIRKNAAPAAIFHYNFHREDPQNIKRIDKELKNLVKRWVKLEKKKPSVHVY